MKALEAREARVLVVEDDSDNRTVISRLLRLSGVAPDNLAAIDGDAAAYLVRTGAQVDIVFLDLQMPKKDGYAVLWELRESFGDRPMRIIALTANVMHRDIARCRDAGFDGFIGKPIDGRRFSELFNRILAGEAVWTED